VEESKEETLLGITFNKRLSWKAHIDKLKPELLKRTAILRRLRMTLPSKTTSKMIEPIFTAKLRYGLELIASVLHENSVAIKQLHALHRGAMKAALGLSSFDHPSDKELLEVTGEMSVRQIAAMAVANLAWKCGRDWENNALTEGRLESHRSGRDTRQSTLRTFPPQSTVGSLPHSVVEMWEKLPKTIQKEEDLQAAKKAIKAWIRQEF